jgi:hypothetical protein
VIPFNPRANEVRETRNGFARGGNTGIPCAGGTCFHAVPNAQFEGGKGMARTEILSSFAASMRVINACIDTIIWSWELASKELTALTNLICCSGL